MDLRSYCDGGLHLNDCVSISVSDYGGGSSTYEGMIINISDQLVTVLFTDGDVENYNRGANKLRLLNVRQSLVVGEKILNVLEKIGNQNNKINEQKEKVNSALQNLMK